MPRKAKYIDSERNRGKLKLLSNINPENKKQLSDARVIRFSLFKPKWPYNAKSLQIGLTCWEEKIETRNSPIV